MELPLLFFLTLTCATASEPKNDHWKQLLWENGIKVLSESENPYNLLSTVVEAIESEDKSVKIEPVINEVLTRILVINSDKSRKVEKVPDGKKGLARFLNLKSDSEVSENIDQSFQKTGDKMMELFGGFHNKSLSPVANLENKLNNTDGVDNVFNWFMSTQKRFNQLTNHSNPGVVDKHWKENVGKGVAYRDASGEKNEQGGFFSHRRVNGFGQVLDGLLHNGGH